MKMLGIGAAVGPSMVGDAAQQAAVSMSRFPPSAPGGYSLGSLINHRPMSAAATALQQALNAVYGKRAQRLERHRGPIDADLVAFKSWSPAARAVVQAQRDAEERTLTQKLSDELSRLISE